MAGRGTAALVGERPTRARRPPRAGRRHPGLPPRRHRERLRQPRAQLLGLRDHLLRPLPRPDLHLQPGGSRGRDPRRLVHPPAHRRRQHRGQPPLPRRQRQPRLPGRAPPLPRHAEHPLRRDRPPGQGHLRALRPPLQQRPLPHAAGDGPTNDLAPRLPRRQAPAEAGAISAAGGIEGRIHGEGTGGGGRDGRWLVGGTGGGLGVLAAVRVASWAPHGGPGRL